MVGEKHGARMTVLDRVKDFLVAIAPDAVCDDCIADELELTVTQHANQKTRELERTRAFDRRVQPCIICKSTTKKAIRYAHPT